MTGHGFVKASELIDQYAEELRELQEDGELPYECQVCGTGSDPEEHKKHAPNWCDVCDKVTTHERRE